ncbi:hypothetical protein [Leptospira sanjuanensis]|uniref:hypothetical protein n=1 Tax=Leptospira sanjuanensis TaxID=2879643 RepID=UPI001EE8D4FD|nr:hypothetical protein [Leptospira sanjuanensis]MCG6167386.1 hypothetical protein [Leptospira sanjuanensis]
MTSLGGVLTNCFKFVFRFVKKSRFQSSGPVSRNVLILLGLLSYSTGLWSAELKYGELLFKCRMEKPRCSSRDVCVIEFYAYPKNDSYRNPFVTLYQGEEKNIKDPEYNFDTKIALPATYERKGEKHLVRVETSEFPLRFVLEIQTDSKKPELASIGLFRENSEDDPVRYYCRQLKAGY